MPIRGKTKKQKLSTNLTLYKAYTKHWTNLRKAEIKRKKELNFEAWKKGELKHNTFKKKKKKDSEKAEKYYTNEGTNQKHRSPNK